MSIYESSLKHIAKYYGVSNECASYLYYRAFRSRRKDDRYMAWTVKLQNAIVKADKCLGIDWEKVYFGEEEDNLSHHGIVIDEMEDKVFRWNEDADNDQDSNSNTSSNNSEWTIVRKKTKKVPSIDLALIKRPGLFV